MTEAQGLKVLSKHLRKVKDRCAMTGLQYGQAVGNYIKFAIFDDKQR